MTEEDRKLLKANLVILHRMYHRAAEVLGGMLEHAPHDAGIRKLLAGVYLEMDHPEAAEEVKPD